MLSRKLHSRASMSRSLRTTCTLCWYAAAPNRFAALLSLRSASAVSVGSCPFLLLLADHKPDDSVSVTCHACASSLHNALYV
jgi:hypothetical protein